MTTQNKVARRKLSLLQLASELSNVSKACQIMGYSRQHFYEIRRNFQTYGSQGLLERFSPEFRERQIETRHTGDLVAVDTFFVGHLKGVGKSISSPPSTAIPGTPGGGSTPPSCR